ncbi:MarR family winged helix-turn-helix transcriptional regulator [Shewanella donghaensis]|uniref:MarR family winged helix-turn-helix transcriptional regulator n=1 Tax=Shewanella donghaensis TaxID=238836 RepID=UPI001183D873|nr:MarR family transcriptional regulator [Shewanella donghaensis]
MDNDTLSDTVFSIVHSYRLAMRSSLKANEIGLNGMHVKCLTFINKSHICTANDIVSFFARDKAQIARLIKDMIDNKWLTKEANPEDRRSQILSLTDEGRKLAELIARTQEQVLKQMQQNLSTAEVAAFTKTAAIIAANLKTFEAKV